MGGSVPTFTTALIDTAHFGIATVLQAMLASGARADVKGSDGNTALHLAVKNHQHAAMRVLLQHSCALSA